MNERKRNHRVHRGYSVFERKQIINTDENTEKNSHFLCVLASKRLLPAVVKFLTL